MSTETAAFERNIKNSIGRHFVSLRAVQRNVDGSVGKLHNWSAFVVEIHGEWFLITAGHVLKNIHDALDANITLDSFSLDDSYRPDTPFPDRLIPFDFFGATSHYVDEPGIGDFAAILLRQHYRDLLSANKILPFSPGEMATTEIETFYTYWVIGLPDELMLTENRGDDTWHKSQLVIIGTTRLKPDELPGEIQSTIRDRGYRTDNFFGRIPDPEELTDGSHPGLKSIVGMSGGPLVGWRRRSDGVPGYSVIGIQSRWWPDRRIVMACPIVLYAIALDRTLQKNAI